jgi:hypothetical protein
MYILKQNSHFPSMEDKVKMTSDKRTEDGKQRSKGQDQWNRATEKGTLGELMGVRGWRNEDGDRDQIT